MLDDESMRHEVRDHERTITFTGQMLGDASSFQAGKHRWTECAIFRTDAGTYIVATVGRSSLPGETDRCRASVSETAEGAVEQLVRYDDDRVRYFTVTARIAASKASHKDEAFARAFNTEYVA